MSTVFIPKETDPLETRAAMTPDSAKKLVELGVEVQVESGLGARCDHPDSQYSDAGAKVVTDRSGALSSADFVFRVSKPAAGEISGLKKGAIHASFLDPFNEPETLQQMAGAGVSAVSLEMIPRTTLAQKMDALSSQANIAGYTAVVLAAERMNKILPMMMTPAGTITPAKIFVLGIGVAGLQAIATAKRLGARVTAFDVRPEALEQAESLGAKALRIDLGGDTGGTDQGYAKELTPEQLDKQREAQTKVCADSDVVITTAKVFGRKSPVLLKADAVAQMKPGSIIVDLAASGGGNVEGTVLDEDVVTDNGVTIIGRSNFEGIASTHASQVLASNFANFLEHFWDKEEKSFSFDLEDEILSGCVLTHGGEVVHERFKA